MSSTFFNLLMGVALWHPVALNPALTNSVALKFQGKVGMTKKNDQNHLKFRLVYLGHRKPNSKLKLVPAKYFLVIL